MDEHENTISAGIPAIIEAARSVREAQVIDLAENLNLDNIDAIPLLVLPKEGGGAEVHSIKGEVDAWRREYATRPMRREGMAVLEDAASFIAHANRFKDPDSAIFVTGGAQAPKFTSVLDYHEALNQTEGRADGTLMTEPGPRFGRHRGSFAPSFSPEWAAWIGANKTPLSQAAFAALIQTNVRDVLDLPAGRVGEAVEWYASRFGAGRSIADFYAGPGRLLDLAEGLTATVTDKVGDVARRDSGETKITFESERATDVEIPVAFVLELPVFVGGDLYQIPVRLRFSLRQEGDAKRAQWRIEMFGADRTVLAVLAEMREDIGKKTGLPIFTGTPE